MFGFDAEFIEKLLKKDSLCFDEFYLKTSDLFFRYIKSHYVIDTSDINDLLADLYYKIWVALDKYDVSYPFDRYIWTILKNTIKDFFKKSRETDFATYNMSHDYPIEEILMSDEDIHEQLSLEYTWQEIDTVIKGLDEFSQDLLHLRFVEQRSYEEMSVITWISEQNLRKKASRIVSNLRKMLRNE